MKESIVCNERGRKADDEVAIFRLVSLIDKELRKEI